MARLGEMSPAYLQFYMDANKKRTEDQPNIFSLSYSIFAVLYHVPYISVLASELTNSSREKLGVGVV